MAESKKIVWVIDDEFPWRHKVMSLVKNRPASFMPECEVKIREFTTVDAAIDALKKALPEEKPTLILTDNNTPPGRAEGVDLAVETKKTGIAVLIISRAYGIEEELVKQGCTKSAGCFSKDWLGVTDTFYQFANNAMEAAGVEKRLGGKLPGQQSLENGGRY